MTLGSSEKSCTGQNLEAGVRISIVQNLGACWNNRTSVDAMIGYISTRMHLLLQDATARIVPQAFQSDQVRILPLVHSVAL